MSHIPEELKELDMRRIRNCLLVGGKGYIGTNLTKKLHAEGIECFWLDKSTGHPAEQLSVLQEIDYIVHLAAYPGVKACKENLNAAVIDNISSAFRVFLCAHNNGIPCIFASSQAAKHPENNLYGLIKRMIEIEAERLNYLNGDIRILRFTNVYGGDYYLDHKLTAIPWLVYAINKEKEFVINGDGEQKRDFIHVDDVCDAIYKCMMHEERLKTPVDIGTGKGTSINEIVNMFQKNYKFKFTFNPDSDIIGPKESVADTELAKELFGFQSKIKIEDWIENLDVYSEKTL